MPTLSKTGEVIEDTWTLAVEPASDAQPNAIVPAERWLAGQHQGLLLEPDAEPAAEHTAASLIAINFPAFNDGRGLSLAVLLRERLGFQGELRAIGDVHPDMLHYLQRSGFDSFELPTHRNVATAQAALKPYSAYYQASITEPRPIFRR